MNDFYFFSFLFSKNIFKTFLKIFYKFLKLFYKFLKLLKLFYKFLKLLKLLKLFYKFLKKIIVHTHTHFFVLKNRFFKLCICLKNDYKKSFKIIFLLFKFNHIKYKFYIFHFFLYKNIFKHELCLKKIKKSEKK